MIQVYKKGNDLYSQNGNHVLHPVSCDVDRTLNGAWELTMELPLDESRAFLDVTAEAVIKAPTPEGEKLFYVYDTEKMAEDCLSVSARPVFLNAASEVFILDTRPTEKSGQEALDILTAGTKYSGRSNITKTSSATYIRKNLIEAIASDNDNSFVNRWGGEVLYDDFSIVINDRVGGDYGVSVLYGKNLAGVSEQVNIEEVVTRIIPVAYNGYTLEGDTPWVDSPLIGSYSHIKHRVIRYDDVKLTEDTVEGETGFGTLELLRQELIRRCNLEFEAGIDKPKITLVVDIVDLADTVEYEDYVILEKISLGDTVYCQHDKLGITTTARVIRQKWDCILQRNKNLVIGEFQANYFDKISSVVNSIAKNLNTDGTLMADRVSGILNGIYTQLRLQSTVAKKVEGRAFVVEDLDPDSPLYGCMQWGTQGLQISTTRTADGKDWDWTTAVTAKGVIANAIIAGLLSDRTGQNYWNLDTGEFRLTSTTFKIDDQTFEEHLKKATNLTVILSNEYQGIPTDSDGNYATFPECSTAVQVLYGSIDITSQCTLTATTSAGVTAALSGSTLTVTALTADTGWVDIKATYLGTMTATKRFNLSKVKDGEKGEAGAAGAAGAAGRVYILEPSATTIKRGQDNALTPDTLVFSAYYRDGTSASRTAYAGRFKIEKSADGNTWETVYTSSANETSCEYELYTALEDGNGNYLEDGNGNVIVAQYDEDAVMFRCTLYAAGGTANALDMQTVAVLIDIAALTQKQVFNLITNNGAWQGLFYENGKLYMNGEYMKFIGANIGGWDISEDAIYKDIKTSDGTIYRVCLQPPTELLPTKTWVLSCRKSTDGGSSFSASFILYSDGSAKFGDTVIGSDGSIEFGNHLSLFKDGTLLWTDTESGDYPAQITRQSDGSMLLSISKVSTDNLSFKSIGGNDTYTGVVSVQGTDGAEVQLYFMNGVLTGVG